ncbi:MAG: hypothetical protein V1495_02230 [Pseudomonadota bacterium]
MSEVGGGVRRLVLCSVLVLTLSVVLVTHQQLKLLNLQAAPDETTFFIPKASTIRPFLLGHEAFLADLLWIRTVGYFADEFYGRGQFKYLNGLLDFITDLDPRFERVYIWAGAILMYRGGAISREKVMESSRILEKGWRAIENDPIGWRHSPDYWLIPQMIGFNWAVELHDRKKGAPYIAAAAKLPGSPPLLKTWAATLFKRAGYLEEGTRTLEDMLAVETLRAQLNTVEDERMKGEIRQRLAFYYSRLYGKAGIEERIRLLEEEIRALLSEWREKMSYVPFGLFLILRNEPAGIVEPSEEETFQTIFPALAPLPAT